MDVKIKAELYIHVGEKYFWNTHKKIVLKVFTELFGEQVT